MNESVVAKVRIVEVIPPPPIDNRLVLHSSIVRVEVVEPIKGVELGQRFVIVGGHNLCGNTWFPVDMTPGRMAEVESRSPFIAGIFTGAPPEDRNTPRLNEERIFRGDWQINADGYLPKQR